MKVLKVPSRHHVEVRVKSAGAKIYSRTKQGDTVNYQLARSRLLGHTSVLTARFWCFLGLKFIASPLILILVGCDEVRRELGKSYDLLGKSG